MENKINIVELLKDCPKGMELDCTMFDNVTFVRVDNNRKQFPIEIAVGGLRSKYLTKEGCFHDTTLLSEAKCVIFPRGKTTWEGFVPLKPKFKCGDVVACDCTDGNSQLFIFKEYDDNNDTVCYLFLDTDGTLDIDEFAWKIDRLATEEEKQKLFDCIKEKGYRWNTETKTLEKLVKPKFKVDDQIVKRNYINNSWLVSSVSSEYYGLKLPNDSESIGVLPVSEQDEYELVPNKFDINTLKPFESKVLIRSVDEGLWKPAIYGFSHSNGCYVVGGACWKCCIPYEGNEHLLGTTNDCADFYKTWEK